MSIRLDVEKYLERCNVSKETMNAMLSFYVKQVMAGNAAHQPKHRLHFIVVGRYEKFRMKNQITLVSPQGKALCLLKTQFAKKPKSPV